LSKSLEAVACLCQDGRALEVFIDQFPFTIAVAIHTIISSDNDDLDLADKMRRALGFNSYESAPVVAASHLAALSRRYGVKL